MVTLSSGATTMAGLVLAAAAAAIISPSSSEVPSKATSARRLASSVAAEGLSPWEPFLAALRFAPPPSHPSPSVSSGFGPADHMRHSVELRIRLTYENQEQSARRKAGGFVLLRE